MAQTPDGYFWLGGEFGLFRFDGVRAMPWQPPAGQELPEKFAFQLVGARDGTLWIGTFSGLVSWDGVKLTRHPEFAERFVQSLFADHEGTVWAATRGGVGSYARLCAMRRDSSQCFGDDGSLGKTVWTISEDRSGVLWIGADSGLWRWNPGPPRRETAEPRDISGLAETEGGHILGSTFGGGLIQFERTLAAHPRAYPMPPPMGWTRPLAIRELNANRMLRDRHGGLWIGTVEHGLIHLANGRTEVFRKADGLSGDIVNCLFEDREGNIWVATTGGIDRFREFPVTTISSKEGLASDTVVSVLGDRDGGVWIGTRQGLTRWTNGHSTILGKANGLSGNTVESLFQDDAGRLWVYAAGKLAYFTGTSFVTLPRAAPDEEAHSITGDSQGNLWLAGNEGLYRIREGRVVERLPWPALGADERAKVIVADRGGVWISFWGKRTVSYLKGGALRALYKTADGLGKGRIADIELDGDGALWVATEEGGLSRVKDGHIATLTTAEGLPCDSIHSSVEDNDRSLWLYTACGLVRIARSELNAWIADPRHRVAIGVLDAGDGVRLRALSPSSVSPVAARSRDGRLWFVTGDSVQVVDPRHLPYNDLPPPVYIEQIVADHKAYWQRSAGAEGSNVGLPPRIRDLQIDYTAVSLVAPEKVHFKYRLTGQDRDWREVLNDREVQYSNLSPGVYCFHVIACNNSGVWNETGDSLDFTIPPAWYQTMWFRAACVVAFLLLLWAIYQRRVQELRAQEKKFREAVETMPALAFVNDAVGNRSFVNRAYLEYTGMSAEQAAGSGWEKAIHPDDLKRVLERWRAAQVTGELMAHEVRVRRGSDGAYRWFQTRARPLFDRRGKVVKWCAVATDIEDRKRAEQLQADLAHVNRVSTLGELAASISHELNQPIAAAIMNADLATKLLERYPPDVTQARQRTTKIVEMGTLASEIIDRLRALYKKELPKRVPLAVNEVIGEMAELLRGQAMRHGASLRTDLADDLPDVIADRVQIQQVLMNLMLNGIEAMSDTGGMLTIKSDVRSDGQIEISVNDNGPGLPSGKADQVFDAFFTTKPQGSGMGLAISKSIVESHGGRIWANGHAGHGVTFHFTLPQAPLEAEIPAGAV
jgi:PAS domain S-box-containing protein